MGRPVRLRPLGRAGRPVEVDALRLAAGALRPGRARGRTPGCCTPPGLLTEADRDALVAGLDRLGERFATGELQPDASDEDVHGALERLLLEEVGAELGGRLRAGRSRNDQVATLFKAFLRDHARGRRRPGARPRRRASRRRPSSTSARSCPAAPTSSTPSRCCSSHHLLAHAWPLLRDVGRLRDWDARVAVDSPYGSGALAGSSLGLDPQEVARDLGFADSSPNSIDGTAPATSWRSSRSWPRWSASTSAGRPRR